MVWFISQICQPHDHLRSIYQIFRWMGAESATETCPPRAAKAYNAIAGALELKPGSSGVEESLDVGTKLIEQAVNSTTYSEGAPLGAV